MLFTSSSLLNRNARRVPNRRANTISMSPCLLDGSVCCRRLYGVVVPPNSGDSRPEEVGLGLLKVRVGTKRYATTR